MFLRHYLKYTLIPIGLFVIFVFVVQAQTWNEPGENPPGGNVAPPVKQWETWLGDFNVDPDNDGRYELHVERGPFGNAKLQIQTGGGDYWELYQSGVNGSLHVWGQTYGDNVMSITEGGNVGIGTPLPAAKLDVAGNVKASGTICANNGFNCIGGVVPAAGGWQDEGDFVRLIEIADQVGIGIERPNVDSKLHVNTPDERNAEIDISTSNSSLYWGIFQDRENGPLRFWKEELNVLTLEADSRFRQVYVGINNDNPSKQLDVVGSGKFTGTLQIGGYTLPNIAAPVGGGYVLKTNSLGGVNWQPDATGGGAGDLETVLGLGSEATNHNSETKIQAALLGHNVPVLNVIDSSQNLVDGTAIALQATGGNVEEQSGVAESRAINIKAGQAHNGAVTYGAYIKGGVTGRSDSSGIALYVDAGSGTGNLNLAAKFDGPVMINGWVMPQNTPNKGDVIKRDTAGLGGIKWLPDAGRLLDVLNDDNDASAHAGTPKIGTTAFGNFGLEVDNAFMGSDAAYNPYAYFGARVNRGAGNYALLQHETGATYLNARSGQDLYFRIDDTTYGTLDSTGNWGFGNPSAHGSIINPTIDLAIGDSDTGLNWAGDGELAVYTNSTEKVRFAADGNVGIGTAAPQATLHLFNQGVGPGETPLRLQYNFGGMVNGDTSSDWVVKVVSSNGSFQIANPSTVRFAINKSGNVGIGTSNPDARLEIVAPNNNEGLRIISSNYSSLVIRNTADTEDLFRVDQSGKINSDVQMTFSVNNSTAMSIDSDLVLNVGNKIKTGTVETGLISHTEESGTNSSYYTYGDDGLEYCGGRLPSLDDPTHGGLVMKIGEYIYGSFSINTAHAEPVHEVVDRPVSNAPDCLIGFPDFEVELYATPSVGSQYYNCEGDSKTTLSYVAYRECQTTASSNSEQPKIQLLGTPGSGLPGRTVIKDNLVVDQNLWGDGVTTNCAWEATLLQDKFCAEGQFAAGIDFIDEEVYCCDL